jgi:hypothetical protein
VDLVVVVAVVVDALVVGVIVGGDGDVNGSSSYLTSIAT